MNSIQLLLSLVVVAASTALSGDRAHLPGRVLSGLASPETQSVGPVPAFALFGWLSPPVDSTTPQRFAELHDAGFNVAVTAYGDSGRLVDNRARLDLAAALGMRCLIFDRRFTDLDPVTPAALARLDSIVADYRDHPGFLGYYLGDEPLPPYGRLERLHAVLRGRDPAHPAYNNLQGRQYFADRDAWLTYLRDYVARMRPQVLSDDQYDFLRRGDRKQFVENAAGLNAVARASGIPYWCVVQVIEHSIFRPLGPGELRWQVSQLLAYGARGVGYFTYWTPNPDSLWNWTYGMIAQDGTRSPWYGIIASFNRHVRPAGEALARLTWMATSHAGSVPPGGTRFARDDWVTEVAGRAALGEFADGIGRRFLLVANSDSANAQSISVTFPRAKRVLALGPDAQGYGELASVPVAGGVRVKLDLDAGDFALLSIEGPPSSESAAGVAPTLAISPNPARGTVRFDVTRVRTDGVFQVLDPAGRRVWSQRLATGDATLDWHGESESGPRSRPGVYYARIEDHLGQRTVRFAWLGAP